MPPSISRIPDVSNQLAFPLEVREIGIPLYDAPITSQVSSDVVNYYLSSGVMKPENVSPDESY